MNERYCTAGRIKCPQIPQCGLDCHFEAATLIRKIKPYPTVPDDPKPADEQWHKIGKVMLCAGMLILLVFFLTMFLTGVWLWGMLV